MHRTPSQENARHVQIHWNPLQPEPQPAEGVHTLVTGERIRRPPNAYLIFAKQRRRELRMDGREGTRMQGITAKMSAEWRAMTPEEKEPFFEVQRRLKREHQEKYPGYVYTPTLSKKTTRNATKSQKVAKTSSEPSEWTIPYYTSR